MPRPRLVLLLLPLAAPLVALPALGQDHALLAGPSVDVEARAPSLVRLAYDGSITPLEVPPAEAAIELLEVDDATRAAIDAILAERAAILDRVVIENVDLLLELQSVKGDRARLREIYLDLEGKLASLRERGSLRDEVAAVLPHAHRDHYLSLISEYENAIEAEARAEAEAQGEPFRERRYRARQRVVALGLELKRSYDRQAGARTEDLDRLLADLALDEETEAEIRRMITDFGQRTLLNPTEADRRALLRDILETLSPEQRRRAVEVMRARAGATDP